MLCQMCKKNNATVHTKRNINGKVQEMYLCSTCSRKMYDSKDSDSGEAVEPLGFSVNVLADLVNIFGSLAPMSSAAVSQDTARCKTCGTSINDIRRTLYVGCPECYIEFDKVLSPILRSVQDSTVHVGSGRAAAGAVGSKEEQAKSVESELRQALDDERYEDAVVLRDKLRRLKGDVD